MHGLLAIDIDGTLTADRERLQPSVIAYLQGLVNDGWQILFVTGRTLIWSLHLLENLPFPYILSVFNGAYTIKMPEKALIEKRYLSCKKLATLEEIIRDFDTGSVIYSAPDEDGRSFFFQKYLSTVMRRHLEARSMALMDNWIPINDLSKVPTYYCAAMRVFCLPEAAKKISLDIEEKGGFHAPVMKDSFDSRFHIVQVTHAAVSKGHALSSVFNYLGKKGIVIACGDDHNDISMLKKADYRVVMATAPAEVLSMADVIAPSAELNGLIVGIAKAIERGKK